MSFKSTIFAALAATALAVPGFAQDITITDAYVRSASPIAKTGAAFLVIENHSDQEDRLIGATSTVPAPPSRIGQPLATSRAASISAASTIV